MGFVRILRVGAIRNIRVMSFGFRAVVIMVRDVRSNDGTVTAKHVRETGRRRLPTQGSVMLLCPSERSADLLCGSDTEQIERTKPDGVAGVYWGQPPSMVWDMLTRERGDGH